MSQLDFSLWVALSSLLAGLIGALSGLGGGVVIVPVLTLIFHIDIRYAIGASLISVIATSSGAAAAYVREGYSNVRIGMFLEVATTLGALLGAYLTAKVSPSAIGFVFGLVLLYSAWASSRTQNEPIDLPSPTSLGGKLRLTGSYPTGSGRTSYTATNVPAGFGLMFLAGALSGLLGIGSGAVKVLAMDRAMKLPFKVSTTTSNFMIGVTAAASAGIYVGRGYIRSGVAMPVILGVLAGSVIGSRILVKADSGKLRLLFTLAIVALGLEMIYSAATGKL